MFVCVIENCSIVRFCKPLSFLFIILVILSARVYAFEENSQSYPDKNGQEALRLWSEKERDREVDEALRRYWDYWTSLRRRGYSAYRLWYELEQTQRWLEDPDHNPPPPPPPLPPPGMMPPPYPYMGYPPSWFYGPWFPYPNHSPDPQPPGSHHNRE